MQTKYAKMLYVSPIGELSLVADDHYLLGIWFQGQKHFERGMEAGCIFEVPSHPVLNPIASYLDSYFSGQVQDLSELPLAPVGSDFEKRVWNYLREIPFGQTVTYGQIAKDLQIASAQAIGGAVGRNPWSILVPCHRVLGAGNRLTGYASGIDKKAWLLKHEGAAFQENKEQKEKKMLEFIEYPKCTTCKKAKKELDQLGLEYKDVHIVEETPSEKVILNWLETSGFELKQFFNTSGIKYRELGLKDKVGTLSNKEAAKLLASDGMLLKRPILVENGVVKQIGYRKTYDNLDLK